MGDIYWACLGFGVVFAVVTILFGEVIDQLFDGVFATISLDFEWLEPTVIVSGITAFGGAGIILLDQGIYAEEQIIAIASGIALLGSGAAYFLYIRPMRDSENSTAFSITDLVGKTGEIITPVPVNGCGEVFINIGAGTTHQIAAGVEGEAILEGAKVVIVAIADGVCLCRQQV